MLAAALPPWLVLDPLLQDWLREDLGRGDRSTQALFAGLNPRDWPPGRAELELKQAGVVAGLPLFERIFTLLSAEATCQWRIQEGTVCPARTIVATVTAPLPSLLMGERVALNLIMPLSGIASLTRDYCQAIADLPTQLVDTRKTTPGLRILQKYATQVGGAINHRWGLDDAVMIKDNHILAAGGIAAAMAKVRQVAPFPLLVEVETETTAQVQEALTAGADIIMLDNMSPEQMQRAVQLIRQYNPKIKIEASGNISLDTIRTVALTGVDYISTSAMVTRSTWLDYSLNILPPA
jgi:nicotinate-nucleotide pyrophosphorylase (carboxylating)